MQTKIINISNYKNNKTEAVVRTVPLNKTDTQEVPFPELRAQYKLDRKRRIFFVTKIIVGSTIMNVLASIGVWTRFFPSPHSPWVAQTMIFVIEAMALIFAFALNKGWKSR